MTQDTPRPVGGGVGHSNTEMDLLAGLWEEAPFARLPIDAPAELRDLVEDIDNPKRVYAIHRASRRHNFQLLVQKYIVQLREGCGADFCTTPTHRWQIPYPSIQHDKRTNASCLSCEPGQP
jgi:hypothetical protein